MRLHVQTIAQTLDSTLSAMTHEGRFLCFVLEDGYREQKVAHLTRIPPGVYRVAQRKEGKFYEKHKARWRHEFVPELMDVPGFKYILIHSGNSVDDTSGCLLVGTIAEFQGNFHVASSSTAYLKVFALIAGAFAKGEAVEIEISREINQLPAYVKAT